MIDCLRHKACKKCPVTLKSEYVAVPTPYI